MLNCGPKPRAVTCAPSPSRRSIEMPGTRCNDSARLVSGNLPMSSALIASTTPAALRLVFIEFASALRMPVTTTVSSVVASVGVGDGCACSACPACSVCNAGGGACWPCASCAKAGLMTITPPMMVNMAFDLNRLSL